MQQQQWNQAIARQWAPGVLTYRPAEGDVDTDQEWNVWEEGGPLSPTGWSSWKKLPTGATTDTPGPVRFRNDLHLFVRGTDKSICDTADFTIRAGRCMLKRSCTAGTSGQGRTYDDHSR